MSPKKLIIDAFSLKYEHWSYNVSYILNNIDCDYISNNEQFNLIKSYNNNCLRKINVRGTKLRYIVEIKLCIDFIRLKYKKIEFLHISPTALLFISLLNLFYKKNILIHLHNDFINSFLKFNIKFLIRKILYLFAISINKNLIFICQNKYVKIYLKKIDVLKKHEIIALDGHPVLSKNFLDNIINEYHSQVDIEKPIFIGGFNSFRGINLLKNFDYTYNANGYNIKEYLYIIKNCKKFIFLPVDDVYRLGCSGIFSDIVSLNNMAELYTSNKLPIYYKRKKNNILIKFKFQFKNSLMIRFGKIGDIVIGLRLTQKFRDINFIYNPYLINKDLPKYLNLNIYIISNIFYLLFKKFDNIYIFSHPNESFKKKSLIYFILFFLRKNKVIYISDENQYKLISPVKLNNGGKYIVFAPKSAEESKDLNIDYIDKIISRLSICNMKIIILNDYYLNLKDVDNLINLSGKTSLMQAINIIKNAKIFIGVDSGLYHIANYFGIRSFVIFSSRLKKLYWLANDINYYYNDTIECSGCNSVVCKRNDNICVNNNFVLESLNLFVNE